MGLQTGSIVMASNGEKLYRVYYYTEKGLAYEGMVYRSLARRLKENPVENVFEGVFPEDMSFVFVFL